ARPGGKAGTASGELIVTGVTRWSLVVHHLTGRGPDSRPAAPRLRPRPAGPPHGFRKLCEVDVGATVSSLLIWSEESDPDPPEQGPSVAIDLLGGVVYCDQPLVGRQCTRHAPNVAGRAPIGA